MQEVHCKTSSIISPFAVFILKLSRNSSKSCDWFCRGKNFLASLEMIPSCKEEHNAVLEPLRFVVNVRCTLFSENSNSICLRSSSDTDSPFIIKISLPTHKPGSRKKQKTDRVDTTAGGHNKTYCNKLLKIIFLSYHIKIYVLWWNNNSNKHFAKIKTYIKKVFCFLEKKLKAQ